VQLTLNRPTVPVYSISGRHRHVNASELADMIADGLIARVVRRQDGRVIRAYRMVDADEVARRVTAAPTVVRVLPTTWAHTSSLARGL
jgi:hypothetical protein